MFWNNRNYFRLSAFLLILFLLGMMPVWAQGGLSPTDRLLRANKLYENGDFTTAIETYEQLVHTGIRDSILFYNLGNAYFKQGDLGNAILNYRRAEQLSPRDADIRANLAVARAETTDRIEGSTPGLLAQMATVSARWLTLNEHSWLALALWILLSAISIAAAHTFHPTAQKLLRWSSAILAVLLIATGIALAERITSDRSHPPAVITATAVDVTSGPGDQYITEFTLHSGAEVSRLETRGTWVRITLPGNKLQGWVLADAVTPLAN